MSTRTLQLHFAGTSAVELYQTHFSTGGSSSPLLSIRGKTPGAFGKAGTFQWTSAVRALSLLLVQAKVVQLLDAPEIGGVLIGDRASPAASLDYALSKQPAWLEEMFGVLADGSCIATRLIIRTNSNRKRPGPVVLALNHRALSPDDISIVWEGKRVERVEVLQRLLQLLRESTLLDSSNQPRTEKLVA